jgi:hypothetical protein
MTLKATIDRLANEFATGVLAAIRASNLEEILSETRGGTAPRGSRSAAPAPKRPSAGKGKAAGRGRRSGGDIEKVVEDIVAVLAKASDGLRSEDLRAKLGLSRAEIMRPIQAALAAKRIKKTGEKRATTYFAAK